MGVLITGSSGFLGSKLVELFNKKGVNVAGFDILAGNDITKSVEIYQVIEDFNAKYSCDTANNATTTDNATTTCDKIDSIIHLAAVSNLNHFANDNHTGHKINVIGTQNIINAAEYYNIPVLFASTCCIYGNNAGLTDVNIETGPVNPTEPYARSKLVSEGDLNKSRKNTGLKHVSMRFCTFFGSQQMRGALAPGVFITKLYNGEPININGDGLQRRCYGHYSLVINGIMTIWENRHNNEYDIINVAPNERYSVWEIITEILKNIRKHPDLFSTNGIKLITCKGRGNEEFDQLPVNNNRLRDIGWNGPEYSFQDNIKDCVESFIKNGCKWVN